MSQNKVIIVGAGPGDTELITIKGLKAIQQADVILYDALVSQELLDYAKPWCQKIFVGKRCGRLSLKQQDINHLLYKMVQRSKVVVRLKGGDPFVFGRGYEELDFLRKKGVHVDVVPGLSTATSLAALQNVPVTSRSISESFWVLTGTTRKHQLSKDILAAIQTSATLVILMGMRSIPHICHLLRAQGKSDTPIMIIQNGSRTDEQVYVATIETIEDNLPEDYISNPGIIIIGEVVRLHSNFVYQKALKAWTA